MSEIGRERRVRPEQAFFMESRATRNTEEECGRDGWRTSRSKRENLRHLVGKGRVPASRNIRAAAQRQNDSAQLNEGGKSVDGAIIEPPLRTRPVASERPTEEAKRGYLWIAKRDYKGRRGQEPIYRSGNGTEKLGAGRHVSRKSVGASE